MCECVCECVRDNDRGEYGAMSKTRRHMSVRMVSTSKSGRNEDQREESSLLSLLCVCVCMCT